MSLYYLNGIGPLNFGWSPGSVWQGLVRRLGSLPGPVNTTIPDVVIAGLGIFVSALLLILSACSREPSDGPESAEPESQAASAALPPANTSEPESLELGETLEFELTPKTTRSFRVEARAGDFIHLVVDQRGIDVVATLLDSEGSRLVQSDRPINDIGPEPLLAMSHLPGPFHLEVRSTAARPAGTCVVTLVELRPASDEDRKRADAARFFSEAEILSEGNQRDLALENYTRALELWKELEDDLGKAECLERIGRELAGQHQWTEAADFHRQAADLFHDTGETRMEAIARNLLGSDYYFLGRLDLAVENYSHALRLRKETGDRLGQALDTLNLARSYQDQDEVQEAFDLYVQALSLLDAEDRGRRAQVLHNLGALHLTLGREDEARQRFLDAEAAWGELGHQRSQAASLNRLGVLHQRIGQIDAASSYYRQALELRREAQDQGGEAVTLSHIGSLNLSLGNYEQAQSLFLESLEILKALGRPQSEARVLVELGNLQLDRGQETRALEYYREAWTLYRRIGDPTGEAESLLGIARTERQRGALSAALTASEEALHIFEFVRPKAIRHEYRASFFATVQRHFELHIELLMELHRIEPEAGYDSRALTASESARARSLMDLLTEAGADVHVGVDLALGQREKNLQRRLNVAEHRRLRLRNDSEATEADVVRAEESVALTHEELQELRAEIRIQHPRYAALTEAPVLSLTDIQHQVLDEDTLLLEYRLGEEKSFLWVAALDSLTSFELPGRETVERLVRRAYQRIQVSHRFEARASVENDLCELAKEILHPAADQMGRKRLLVVGDGALLYVPFAVLPKPGDGGCATTRPLILEHEITYLPSASTLALHRRELRGRNPAPRMLAVFADPVFESDDERLAGSAESTYSNDPDSADGTSDRAVDEMDLSSFKRLPFSRREAEAILEWVPAEDRLRALDFDAAKDAVTGGQLANYRIVHFATHGILHDEHPDLSGIVLSLFDPAGNLRDGFLRTHEIYNLELISDLVVLSACQTAGKEVRGEGLVGLTRGFMYAGAARVMVSLWNVDDESTAELMRRFYEGLLRDGLTPAAALQAAQASLWKSSRWTAPAYWAGFVVVGEWR